MVQIFASLEVKTMTVRDLIEELQELPQDLPVVTDYKEIKNVDYCENFYFLNQLSKLGYDIGPAIVLE